MELADPDGDGWGECVPTSPLDAATVIWWHRLGAFQQAICDGGYDAANAGSPVPGGLDHGTFDFFCARLPAEQPPQPTGDLPAP
jgi:hypothetical protein